MWLNVFYWQIGTNVSIGSEIPFFIFPITIFNETNFQFKGMGLNAWVGESFGTFYSDDNFSTLTNIVEHQHDMVKLCIAH